MTGGATAAERVTLSRLAWISACLVLALLAEVVALPLWVTITVGATVALRLGLAARGHDAPPRRIRLLISVFAIGLLFVQLRSFNGLSAGTALLSLIAGLKLLETRTRRDIYVISMIVYFLSLAALLHGESFWLPTYLIGVCWLTTATLLRLTSSGPAIHWRSSIRRAGRLLAQAAPLAAALWLFFPRFGGPLWHLPDGLNAASGLSDTMSPGDITNLALSDDVAFRARFEGAAPPPEERYWRGPVLHDFDGHTWRRTDSGPVRTSALPTQGRAYRYTVSLEPNEHHWIFVLDWPSRWNVERAFLTGDYMLMRPTAISQALDVAATSYSRLQAGEPLSAAMRRRDTYLPQGPNPRAMRLAREMRAAHPLEADYVRAVLDLFRAQPFYYTLRPPLLDADSVDGFLFDSQRGFCGHYASAFAALMRAAGIPARVVTGYHGGTYNRFADYWILRQSDAHAWDEIWTEGQGWQRVDPTAMIPPERVEGGLNDLVSTGRAVSSRWQQRTPWLTDTRLRLDALRLLWRQRILGFNQNSQEKLLTWLHVPEPDGQKLALMLGLSLIVGMAWLTWSVRREMHELPRDPVVGAYARLCRRLEGAGVGRLPHEGAETFAARVAALRPDLAKTVNELCGRYCALRYAAGGPPGDAVAAFIAGVRRFRPRGSRGSS